MEDGTRVALDRLPPRRPRRRPLPGSPRVAPLPQGRRLHCPGLDHLRLSRLPWHRRRAHRYPGDGRLHRSHRERVHRPGATGQRRGHGMARRPGLVHRRARDVGNLLGRVQRFADRDAAAASISRRSSPCTPPTTASPVTSITPAVHSMPPSRWTGPPPWSRPMACPLTPTSSGTAGTRNGWRGWKTPRNGRSNGSATRNVTPTGSTARPAPTTGPSNARP